MKCWCGCDDVWKIGLLEDGFRMYIVVDGLSWNFS